MAFTAAADALVTTYGKNSDGYMISFLLGRAFELALKSALLAHGMPLRTVASFPYAHNLVNLVTEAESRGLRMIDDQMSDTKWAIAALSDAYDSKELEYQEFGRSSGPTPVRLRQMVHFALQRACLHGLTSSVRERLLRQPPSGMTLDALERY